MARRIYYKVDLTTNSTTVTSEATRLHRIWVEVAVQSACPVEDGAGNTLFTIPASTAAGTLYDFGGVEMPSGIVVDPADADTDGDLVVIHEPGDL